MLKFRFTLFLLSFSITLFAQRSSNQTTGVIVASEFHVTRPIREIFAENPVDESKIYKDEESEDRDNNRKPQKFRFKAEDGPEYGNDPSSVQNEMGNIPGRAP